MMEVLQKLWYDVENIWNALQHIIMIIKFFKENLNSIDSKIAIIIAYKSKRCEICRWIYRLKIPLLNKIFISWKDLMRGIFKGGAVCVESGKFDWLWRFLHRFTNWNVTNIEIHFLNYRSFWWYLWNRGKFLEVTFNPSITLSLL